MDADFDSGHTFCLGPSFAPTLSLEELGDSRKMIGRVKGRDAHKIRGFPGLIV